MARPHSHILADIVRKHPDWRTGAEIGVFRGATLFHLLDTFPALSMIGVDKWENLPDGTYSRHNMPRNGVEVRARAKSYGERCKILFMDSVAAAAMVDDETLDFVFIDALHTYEAASADIKAWMPKVKPGGLVTGHDWHYPTVAQALDELLPGWVKHFEWVWTCARPE